MFILGSFWINVSGLTTYCSLGYIDSPPERNLISVNSLSEGSSSACGEVCGMEMIPYTKTLIKSYEIYS